MPEPAYSAHEHLIAPARPFATLWRLVAAALIIALVVMAGNLTLFNLLFVLVSESWADTLLSGGDAGSMLVLLASFGFVTLGVTVAARLLQKRTLASVVGQTRLALKQFWSVFRLLLILAAVVLILPPYNMGEPLVPNQPFATWMLLLPLSVPAVFIQVSAEEILFRGYLQQSLAARFSHPLVWMGLPSLLFALGHYDPSVAGDNAWLIAVWSGLFGLLMADLTARAGTLGPAIALHLFNNLVALLIVAIPENLNGLSLYLIPFEMSDTQQLRAWLLVDFLIMLIGWLIARIALKR